MNSPHSHMKTNEIISFIYLVANYLINTKITKLKTQKMKTMLYEM